MKMRFDFVSNSSSCSFFVSDCKAAVKVFNAYIKSNDQYPLCLDNTTFTLNGPEDALKKIAKEIQTSESRISPCYDGWYELPDLNFPQVAYLKLSLLKHVRLYVSADKYDESNTLFVRLLYALLKSSGIDIDNTGEFSLDLNDDDSFLMRLFKDVIEAGGYT